MSKGYYVERLMVYWVISLSIGILLAHRFSLGINIGLIIGLIGILLTIYLRPLSTKKIVSGLLMIALGIALLGWQQLPKDELGYLVGEQISIEGKVKSSPINKRTLVVEIETINNQVVYSDARISVLKHYDDEQRYRRGETVTFVGQLSRPEPETNPGGFSSERYYASQGIYFTFKAKGEGSILAPATGITRLANGLQEYMQSQLEEHLEEEQYHIVLALLFGEKGLIDSDFYDISQKFGIAHVFAVSGLHVGFIVAFLLGIAGLARLERSYWFLFIMIGILMVYCVMTNLTPSALRASMMAILAMIATKVLRYKDIYTLLAIAAGGILLMNPGALWSVGFQLSFISTWGLVYLFSLAKRMLRVVVPEPLINYLAVPIAAQLASAPLVAYYFYLFTPFSPIANLIIVPIISVIVPLLLLALVIGSLVPMIDQLVYFVAEGLLVFSQWILELGAQLFSTGHVYIGQPLVEEIILYFLILVFFREKWDEVWLRQGSKMWYGMMISSVCIILILFIPMNIGRKEVTFLDVGQGSSAVLNYKGRCVVFDGGPRTDIVANFLHYRGINRIPLVILSHPDDDHITGLTKVLRDISVDNLVIPQYNEENELLQQLLQVAAEEKVNIIKGKSGTRLQIGEKLEIGFLTYGQKSDSSNNRSLIAVVDVEDIRIVFPGDIDQIYVDDLVEAVQDIDIWAVPHHGSKNSYYDQLYRQIQPKIAVISAGRENRYGHPHALVIEGLNENHVAYYRTDQQGAITIELEQHELFGKGYRNMLNFQKQ